MIKSQLEKLAIDHPNNMEKTIKKDSILDTFKVVSFSDTHNLHDGVILPECDIAIFCGDYSGRGNKFETLHFFRWLYKQEQCKYKVIIPGNHDICFDTKFNDETHANNWLDKIQKSFSNIIILNNNMVNIENVKIWGSPITPWYHGDRWGYNMHQEDIHNIWEQIPPDMDIVVTHGPVKGILDKIHTGQHVGCPVLKRILFEKVKPQYHVFGHIHESYGVDNQQGITFINSSIVNLEYENTNKPILFRVNRNNLK